MEQTLALFNKIVSALLEDEKIHPVAEYIPSDKLMQRLDLSLEEYAISEKALEEALNQLVFTTPRTATNAFFNQLFGGRQEKAVLGDLLSVMLNNSMYTYKAAGPQVGAEKSVISAICNLIGWNEQAGGTIAAGGSMTNLMSMLMARDAKNPKIRTSGMNERMTVYTSEESHYSITKNAAFAGIGRNNVREIKTDTQGRMDNADLRNTILHDIEHGYQPILINCTAGTTVLGAFDDIVAAHAIAKEFNCWLHVDGAYCGSVLFSQQYKQLLKGIELVDSFSLNAHKMLGTPLSCSLILVKNKEALYDSFANDASYLYQTDHDEYNLGKTSLQCGRRNDALKLWVLWKSVGTKGLENIVDKQFALADVARNYIKNHPDYTHYSIPNSISVCFNYQNIPARQICTLLYEHETLLVGYGSFRDNEFIRLVTINATNQAEDILNFFKTLEDFVAQNMDLFHS